jgi:DNA-binding response OmpR family regulator
MKRAALIVEDDPALLAAMTRELERANFRVVGALHYHAAVEHLASAASAAGLSLVCIDLGLPTLSGYQLCEYIRGPLGLTMVPILVTSEFGLPEAMASAEEAGASAFLQKPFGMREFSENVDALFDRVRPSEQHLHRLQLLP